MRWITRLGMEVPVAGRIRITDAPIGAAQTATCVTGLICSPPMNCRLALVDAGQTETALSIDMLSADGKLMPFWFCRADCPSLCSLLQPRTTALLLAPTL